MLFTHCRKKMATSTHLQSGRLFNDKVDSLTMVFFFKAHDNGECPPDVQNVKRYLISFSVHAAIMEVGVLKYVFWEFEA